MIRHARMLGPPDAVPARARPRQHRGPVRARRDPREGGREPRAVARPRALPRADVGVRRSHPRGHPRPAATARRQLRLGPPALHDGRGQRPRRPGRLRAALPRRPRVSHRGAHQLVPRLPDERQRPRGDPDARDGHALDDPLPPARRGDRRARPGRHDRRSRRPGPRRSSATRPSPSIPTTRGTRRSSAGACGSRSSSATCRSSRTRSSTRRSGPARSRSRPPTTTTTTRPGSATASRCRRSSTTRRGSRTRGRATTAWTATTPGPRILEDLEARGRPRGRASPTRWSSAAASAATTSWSRASRPSGSSGRGRSPRRRSRRPAAARRAILPERFDKIWEHWMTEHPRLERVAAAVVGPPDPGLVLPGRARHRVRRSGRPARLRGLRPARAPS